MIDKPDDDQKFLRQAEKFRLSHFDARDIGTVPNSEVRKFRSIIYGYFQERKRDFPWRRTRNPYHVLVSEIMLQQTQTERVKEKYIEFIHRFESIESLAEAELNEVLAYWQGLGYNRRGMYLHRLARQVVSQMKSIIPDTPEELNRLPGIGKATSASICAFAFNKPVIFIETNIRTVFLFFFFPRADTVSDSDIFPLVELTLDICEPGEWYSALMDFGAMLKRHYPNPGRKSAHHVKQSPFKGSRRQLRGQIMRELLATPGMTLHMLSEIATRPVDVVIRVATELANEGLIKKINGRYFIND